MNIQKAIGKILDQYGSREVFLGNQLVTLSMTGQPCDVTFFKKKPAIDVIIDPRINIALMYGAGAKKLKEMLTSIKLSNGDVISIEEIWTINPMPKGGISTEELNKVDMSKAEERVGPNGETLRKMISDTYHCETEEQENMYLRKFIAS
ncbi:MAG: hypothetical protein HQ580_00120 [Planctomycetes bacterium]|nr:hypothetical protein [Planctomycetota bacterium]